MTLPLFEKQKVTRATVRIMKAGDGLSEALRIEPVAHRLGEDVYFVLQGRVTGITHSAKDDDVLSRVHVITTEQITEVAAGDVETLLKQSAEKLEAARADAAGQPPLGED